MSRRKGRAGPASAFGRTIGMPAAIADLERRIDDEAGTARWVKGDE